MIAEALTATLINNTQNHLPMLQNIPATLKKDKTFNRLFTRAEIANLSPRQRRAYDLSLKDYQDYHHVIHSTRQRGMEQGAANRSIELAKSMAQKGFETKVIQDLTGLSKAAIERLK